MVIPPLRNKKRSAFGKANADQQKLVFLDKKGLDVDICVRIHFSQRVSEIVFKIQEAVFVELFKKAFPSMRDNINLINIAKNCYHN